MNFFSSKSPSSNKKDAGAGSGSAGSGSAAGGSAGNRLSSSLVGGMTNIVCRLSKSWDIKMPPPTKTVLGFGINGGLFDNRMIETGVGHFNIIQRKRKIVIEIHCPNNNIDIDIYHSAIDNSVGVDDGGEVVGDGSSSGSLSMVTADDGNEVNRKSDLSSELKDDDLIVIRILKPRRGRWGIHKDYKEESESESESESDSDVDEDENEDEEEEDEDEDEDDGDYCCNVTSSFLPSSKREKERSIRKNIKKKKWLQDVLKEQRASNHTRSNTTSAAHHHGGSGDLTKNTKYTISREDTEWIEYRKFGLDEINQDDEQYRKTWEATIGIEKYRERRKLIFNSVEEAKEFKSEINILRKLSKHRATQRLQAYKKLQLQIKSQTKNRLSLMKAKAGTGTGVTATAEIIDTDHPHHHGPNQMIQSISQPLDVLVNVLNPVNIVHTALNILPFEVVSVNPSGTTGVALQQRQQQHDNNNNNNNNNNNTTMMDDNIELNDDISLLVEIVSCSDLPVADITSTDPYVVVFLGVNAIHKTEYIPKE
jgi:hypothetical protein